MPVHFSPVMSNSCKSFPGTQLLQRLRFSEGQFSMKFEENAVSFMKIECYFASSKNSLQQVLTSYSYFKLKCQMNHAKILVSSAN